MKQVFGFSGYLITKNGRVWSEPKKHRTFGKWLKPRIDTKNYLFVSLRKNSRTYNKSIHRLVLETYISPCPDGMECRHLNGNSKDNRLINLTWGTKSENQKDRIKHGTGVRGKNNPMVKLTEQDVRTIIYMWRTGLFTQKEISEIYNISYAHISDIVNKKKWKHIWTD